MTDPATRAPATPTTHVLSSVVRPAQTAAFNRWAERLDASAARAAGHIATVRLSQAGNFHHMVHGFADAAAFHGWREAPDTRRLVAEGEALVRLEHQVGSGGDARFSLPAEADAAKWKTFLATWVAVFPVLLALNLAVRRLPVQLPVPVQLLVTSPILTAILTWFILPRIRALLRPWMLADAANGLRTEA